MEVQLRKLVTCPAEVRIEGGGAAAVRPRHG